MTTLVIAAHPDDEILGCGGFTAKLSAAGETVHHLILAEGATSRDAARDAAGRGEELSELARCARAAGEIVGAASVSLEAFPDNRMDGVDLLDVVKVIERHIAERAPTRVLTHAMSDVNIDHRIVHDAVIAATRPQPGNRIRELLFFEIMSSSEWRPPASLAPFAPDYFVDISARLDAKLAALRAYAPEMRDWPHPRSVRALDHLARLRGASIGVEAAEAFMVGRICA
ncbi:PIG-L deacetylase family protein [Erythrobacter sp. HL-111]|uniref:PIG-L deacetylase family protein n=1 Tax=Erythrobacter sp. HL-111 TaxID=1798193 RepID=UPI0006DA5AFA|nr:PIG-L deacetylase family protein [Erythrobacter sp. HL-111]KPP95468.1 MAG: putative LmbE-like protein [Erythrobacteraceae bacterium HL-111]SDS72009.1 N-acetylglucosaminyl deacetylase, LmbE family [Erythrobacter sp. HL-111]